jgi:hypothetical protein
MPVKKVKRRKKKRDSWESIGKLVGRQIEKDFDEDECCKKPWYHASEGDGFFGRLIFIIGLLYALNHLGYLNGAPTWTLILIGIGFAFMKF